MKKTSGSDEITVQLFQILKDDAVNVLHSIYKKDPNDPNDHDGMVIHIEPDILECEVGLRKHYYEES